MKSREKDLEQVLTDLADRPLGRHIVRILVVQASHVLVRGEEIGHELGERFIHQVKTIGILYASSRH